MLDDHAPSAEDYVRQVLAEPIEAGWATPAARTLEDDLREKGERLGFRPRQVICRTASCFAELDFPSLSKAKTSFKAMFAPPNHLDCPMRFLFPSAGDDDAPVLGILVVDCREKRATQPKGSE